VTALPRIVASAYIKRMRYKIIKPITTTFHRLHAGDECDADDLAGPIPIATRIERGEIVEVKPIIAVVLAKPGFRPGLARDAQRPR
jgi:hypothetical protein